MEMRERKTKARVKTKKMNQFLQRKVPISLGQKLKKIGTIPTIIKPFTRNRDDLISKVHKREIGMLHFYMPYRQAKKC